MSEQDNLAFVFPGQGSQSIGMLSELAESFSVVKETFEQASDALSIDLWQLVQQGPVEVLSQTDNTQPAMMAAGVATWRVWCDQSSVRPKWVAGHSLGEYTALVCSNAIDFEEGIALVAERGRLMQDAVPSGIGAMAAILGLSDDQVIKVCEENAGQDVVAAVNFNAPGQVVIAGHTDAVMRVMSAAKEEGAKRAIKLPVSVPSHCALMESAAEKLVDKLQSINFSMPEIKLVHNVDVLAHETVDRIRQSLTQQLYMPVRWVESVEYMHQQGVATFVECGPGKVLMGVNKRIVKGVEHLALLNPATFEKSLELIDG